MAVKEKSEEIIQVATSQFSRKGVKAVTMDGLAQQCGISKKTLYLHFRDKDDLLLKVLAKNYRTINKQIPQASEKGPDKHGELGQLFALVKIQSKVLTPIFLTDLMKYHQRLNRILEWRLKKVVCRCILTEEGGKFYQWQLSHIFYDLSLPEDERQLLLDEINAQFEKNKRPTESVQ